MSLKILVVLVDRLTLLEKEKVKRFENTTNMFKKDGIKMSSQATVNNMWKKKMREDTCEKIDLFIYNNVIPFCCK